MRLAFVLAILSSACQQPDLADPAVDPGKGDGVPSTYTNPAMGAGADPGVARIGDTYLMSVTSGSSPDAIPIRASHDLVHWTSIGAVLPRDRWPAWATGDFWAPELHHVGDAWVALFVARYAKTSKPAIGAAWTRDLEDWEAGRIAWSEVHWETSELPLVADDRVIDPAREDLAGFLDPSYLIEGGRHYLYFNRDLWTNKPDGVWRHEGMIYAQELAVGAAGLPFLAAMPGADRSTVLTIDQPWEADVIEGAQVVRRGGMLFLIYSANRYWEGKYQVGVARSTSPTSGFVKRGTPILVGDAEFKGPGHGTLIPGEHDYYVYHAYEAGKVGDGFPRLLMLDAVDWSSGWPIINDGTPSSTPQPVP